MTDETDREIARASAMIEARAAQIDPGTFAPAPPFAFDPNVKPVVVTYESAGVAGLCAACVGVPGSKHGDVAVRKQHGGGNE